VERSSRLAILPVLWLVPGITPEITAGCQSANGRRKGAIPPADVHSR
jgi:hypothetical protein